MVNEITATSFKARCLAFLDQVDEEGAELLITKRGRPVARVVPVGADRPLAGSVRQLVDDEALVAPLDEPWDANA